MSNKLDTPYSFVSGYVKDSGTCFILGQFDDIDEMSVAIKWEKADKKIRLFDFYEDTTQIAVSDKSGFITGISGTVSIINTDDMYIPKDADSHDDDNYKEEEIDDSDDGVETYGDIRELRIISDELYAVGMRRQVYHRVGSNQWRHEDNGVLDDPANTKSVSGFNSMDAIGDTMCAVGFGGEIWWRKKDVWTQMDSPTNVILNKVKAVKNDMVYICGKGGVLLKGNDQTIHVIGQSGTEDEIWCIEWYNDTLYAATRKGLYILEDDDLSPVNMGGDGDITCGFLHANDGVLMSVGIKDVYVTEDGKNWEEITPRYKQQP